MPITETILHNTKLNPSGPNPATFPVKNLGNLPTDPTTGQPCRFCTLNITLSAADAANASNTVNVQFLASFDGGVTFAKWYPDYNWQGGVGPHGNTTQPQITNLPVPVDSSGNVADQAEIVVTAGPASTQMTADGTATLSSDPIF